MTLRFGACIIGTGIHTDFRKGARIEMSSAEKSGRISKSRRVSVWNWLGTLILLAIPGVNILALIAFLALSRAQAKRSFCVAYLILLILAVVLVCGTFLAFPKELSEFAAQLRTMANEPKLPFT